MLRSVNAKASFFIFLPFQDRRAHFLNICPVSSQSTEFSELSIFRYT
jgi:hypothetical protein